LSDEDSSISGSDSEESDSEMALSAQDEEDLFKEEQEEVI
jgi:hypothetical protein